jgi:hypothetical protein
LTLNILLLYSTLKLKSPSANIFKDFPSEKLFAGTITKWRFNWAKTECFFRKYGDDYFKTVTDYYSPINYRVIRYADVLLCYAECLAELNDYDPIDEEWIHPQYPEYQVKRYVVIFGGSSNITDIDKLALILSDRGDIFTSQNTPQTIQNALAALRPA